MLVENVEVYIMINHQFTVSSSGPSRPDGSGETAYQDKATSQPKACRVVFVEDDYLTALSVVDALEGAGYDVAAVARTGEDAVRAVQAAQPDLVVMDVRLNGGLDGVDAAVEIFRQFGIRSVFATAHIDNHTRQRAVPAQPLAWVAKPYSETQLLNVLESARTRLN